jgi:hypothetical protein
MASFKGFVEGLTGVATEAGSHLIDPSGKKRGTVAYEELMNSMQPALAKEVLDYERNTRFWVEHDAMLKRTNRSATDWRNAKLENELLILKDFYKDTDYTFDIAAEKDKLKNSSQWQTRMTQYEDLMNKGKKYELTIDDLKTEKGRAQSRAKHIGPIQARMELLGKEIYKNYGLKGDIKAILGNMGIGKGNKRSLTEAPLGNSNFNVLLPEAADAIELKRLNSIVKAIEGEGINNLDLQLMRTAQEGITVDPTLTLRDPINISKLLINTRTEGVIKGFYSVQASAKDSTFPQIPDSEKIKIGKDLENPAEVLHTLYNQSNAGLSAEQGGNAFADIKADHQQIAALIANIGTSEDYKINIVENYSKISMAAWDIIKNRITENKINSADPLDYVRGSNRLMYAPLDNNEKLNLIAKMPEILESLGGNKATIAAAVPELKKAMKQSLEVTNLNIVQDTVKVIKEGPRFASQADAIDMVNYINNPESEFNELSESEREYLSEEVTNKFKSERDPFFTPTKELGSDFYSRRLQEDIDSGEFNNITQEISPIPEAEAEESKTDLSDLTSAIDVMGGKQPSLLEENKPIKYSKEYTPRQMNNKVVSDVLDIATSISSKPENYNSIIKRFLMMVANYESDYGTNRNTFRTNPDLATGFTQMIPNQSIKEIREVLDPALKAKRGGTIRKYNQMIIKELGSEYDLFKMTNEDMKKPLHHALMARAYLLRFPTLPKNELEWGEYYMTYWNTGDGYATAEKFLNKNNIK